MPVSLRMIGRHVWIADILMPTSRNLELRPKILSADGVETDAAHPLLIEQKGGVIGFRLILASSLSEEPHVTKRAVGKVDWHIEGSATFASGVELERMPFGQGFVRGDDFVDSVVGVAIVHDSTIVGEMFTNFSKLISLWRGHGAN